MQTSLLFHKFLFIHLKKIVETLCSFEFLFVLFLFSYQYKNILPMWSGPDITFIAAVLCFISGIWIWNHEHTQPFWQLPTLLALMFTVWVILSYIQQPEMTTYAKSKFWIFILFTMPTFLMAKYVIGGSYKRIHRLFHNFILFGGFVLACAYGTYILHNFQMRDVLGNNYLVTGQTLSVCFLLLIIYFCIYYNPATTMTKISILLVLTTLSFINLNLGGRGPVVASLIALTTLWCYHYYYTKDKQQLSIALRWIIITLVLGTWLQQLLWHVDQFHFTTRLAASVDNQMAIDQSLLSRFDYYQSAWQMLWDYPSQGVGFGRWFDKRLIHDEALHPHNLFLEMGAELGFVGLILFLLFIASCLYCVKRYWGHISYAFSGSLILFIFSVTNAMKSGDVNDNILLFAILGLLAGQAHPSRQIIKVL